MDMLTSATPMIWQLEMFRNVPGYVPGNVTEYIMDLMGCKLSNLIIGLWDS